MVTLSTQVETKAYEPIRPVYNTDHSSEKRLVGALGQSSALVLAGGVALGAYEAGAYEALETAGDPRVSWLAGSSIGAVNAAIIAGNPPAQRVERLRQFWDTVATEPKPVSSFWFDRPSAGLWRRAYNRASVLQTGLFGRLGVFRPRLPVSLGTGDVPGLYDVAPLRRTLNKLIDFERLNHGEVRLSVAATDVVTGERVVFDTHCGARIEPEHLLASSALMPLFAPVEVEGRLLGDGGLAANTPLDLILDESVDERLVCFVVELFDRKGSRPRTLSAAAARALDLIFGNQTRRIFEGRQREHELRAIISRLAGRLPPKLRNDPEIATLLKEGRACPITVLSLGYQAGTDETGPMKAFDFSTATIADRWQRGSRDMQIALRRLEALPPDAALPSFTACEV
jgi:NTE family protein